MTILNNNKNVMKFILYTKPIIIINYSRKNVKNAH